MLNNYYEKHKENLQKEACERYQYLSEEEKDKKHMLVSDLEIFLKKRKKRSINMVVNNIKNF